MLANKDIIAPEDLISVKMQALVEEGRLSRDIMAVLRPQRLHITARLACNVDLLRMASKSKNLVWQENKRLKEHQWLALSAEAGQFQVIQPRRILSHRSEIVKISISVDYEK